MRLRFLTAAAVATSAFLGLTAAAQAQVYVIDTPSATHCSMSANAPLRDDRAIATCSDAIARDELVGRNLAGTYTNRGVLQLRAGAIDAAMKDFDVALDMDDRLGEAWIDRAAGLLQQMHYQEAIGAADRGLMLARRGQEMAFYIRAVARENLMDDVGAYRDFNAASKAAPTWTAPRTDIARFEVRPASRSN